MDLAGAASIATIVVALLALVGVLAISFRTGRNAQILSNAEAIADSWKDRAAAMEEKAKGQGEAVRDLQDKLAAKDHEIGQLQGEILTLRDLVTGRSAIQELASQLTVRNAQIDDRIEEMLGLLRDSNELLREMREDGHGSSGIPVKQRPSTSRTRRGPTKPGTGGQS